MTSRSQVAKTLMRRASQGEGMVWMQGEDKNQHSACKEVPAGKTKAWLEETRRSWCPDNPGKREFQFIKCCPQTNIGANYVSASDVALGQSLVDLWGAYFRNVGD